MFLTLRHIHILGVDIMSVYLVLVAILLLLPVLDICPFTTMVIIILWVVLSVYIVILKVTMVR